MTINNAFICPNKTVVMDILMFYVLDSYKIQMLNNVFILCLKFLLIHAFPT